MQLKREKNIASTGVANFADARAIQRLFETATTLDAAIYFREQYVKQIEKAGVKEQFQAVVEEIDNFVEMVKNSDLKNSNYWSGESKDTIVSKIKEYHRNLSVEAARQLEEKLIGRTIQFSFSIDAHSELLQGGLLVRDNPENPDNPLLIPLDETQEEQLNVVFADWLVENGMLCEGGKIFYSDAEGNITKNNVPPDIYQRLFVDPDRGFQKFFQAKFASEKPENRLTIKVEDLSGKIVHHVQPEQPV